MFKNIVTIEQIAKKSLPFSKLEGKGIRIRKTLVNAVKFTNIERNPRKNNENSGKILYNSKTKKKKLLNSKKL